MARTAVQVAKALLQSGARALVAAGGGPLADELRAGGGEWIPLANATINPFKLRSCGHKLERLISSERIDIVHAQSIGGAWAANMAASQIAVWLVTTLPDVPPVSGLQRLLGKCAGARRSRHHAIQFCRSAGDGSGSACRASDSRSSHAASTRPPSIPGLWTRPASTLCAKRWRISPSRIVLVPGRVAPWNGQLMLPELARILLDSGMRDFALRAWLASTRASRNMRASSPSRRRTKDVGNIHSLCRPLSAICQQRLPQPIPY